MHFELHQCQLCMLLSLVSTLAAMQCPGLDGPRVIAAITALLTPFSGSLADYLEVLRIGLEVWSALQGRRLPETMGIVPLTAGMAVGDPMIPQRGPFSAAMQY